jgi:hypothetical protein
MLSLAPAPAPGMLTVSGTMISPDRAAVALGYTTSTAHVSAYPPNSRSDYQRNEP